MSLNNRTDPKLNPNSKFDDKHAEPAKHQPHAADHKTHAGEVKGAAVAQAAIDEQNKPKHAPDVTQETVDAQTKAKVDRMSEAQTGGPAQTNRGQAIDPGAIAPKTPGDQGGTGASVGPLTAHPDEKTIAEKRNPRPEPNSGQNPAG